MRRVVLSPADAEEQAPTAKAIRPSASTRKRPRTCPRISDLIVLKYQIYEACMSLASRQAGFLLLAAGTACHKPASAAQAGPTYYVLERIDGKALPASWNVGGTSFTTTWGKLWLYPDGKATTMEYRTYGKGGGTTTGFARYYTDGDSIKLAYRPCKAPCFLGYVGKISDSTLTLTVANTPQSVWPVYLYRRSTVVTPPPREPPIPKTRRR
jgi:hypothetical protein